MRIMSKAKSTSKNRNGWDRIAIAKEFKLAEYTRTRTLKGGHVRHDPVVQIEFDTAPGKQRSRMVNIEMDTKDCMIAIHDMRSGMWGAIKYLFTFLPILTQEQLLLELIDAHTAEVAEIKAANAAAAARL